MAEVMTGTVVKIFTNDGVNKRGKWFAKSFKLAQDGIENNYFFQMGFNVSVSFEEGDTIEFQATPKDDRAMTVVEGSVKTVSASAPAAPAAPTAAAAPSAHAAPARKSAKTSELFGEIGGYFTEDDIRRISYANCRGDAINTVRLLLEHDGLPISEAKGKAGQPKRFEAITAAVDKLTVEYYFDSGSGRKLDSVADAGIVDLAGDGSLPDSGEA